MRRDASTWRLGPDLCVQIPFVSPLQSAMNVVFEGLKTTEPPVDAHSVLLDILSVPNGEMVLSANGAPVTRVRSTEYLPAMLEGSVGGLAVHARPECLVFHAGLVVLDGRSVLLLGGKGSGKSTLSLWLARHGAKYFADEQVFIRLSDHRLEAFPKAATIKQGAASLFPDGVKHPDVVRGPLRYILPSDPARPGEETALDLIVLPRFDADSDGSVTRLEPHEVALMFVQQCFGGLGRDPRAIHTIANLSEKPAHLIEFRDCAGAEQEIRKLLKAAS